MYQVEGTIIPWCSINNFLVSLRVLFIPRAFSGRSSLAESAVGILAISRNGGTDTITANDDIGAVKIDKYDLGVFVLFHNCKLFKFCLQK
jgi:hypothetical protein